MLPSQKYQLFNILFDRLISLQHTRAEEGSLRFQIQGTLTVRLLAVQCVSRLSVFSLVPRVMLVPVPQECHENQLSSSPPTLAGRPSFNLNLT